MRSGSASMSSHRAAANGYSAEGDITAANAGRISVTAQTWFQIDAGSWCVPSLLCVCGQRRCQCSSQAQGTIIARHLLLRCAA